MGCGAVDSSNIFDQNKQMRYFFALSFFGAVAAAHAATIGFTFDTNNQGWTKGDFGSSFGSIQTNSAGAATWNAGGYLQGSDHGSYAFQFSSNLGGNHGDLMGGTGSLDFQYSGASGTDPFIVLMSSSSFLVLEKQLLSAGTLHNYSFNLDDSETWYFNSSEYYQGASAVVATNANILSVLNDLQYIGISTDITGGADSTITDNVFLRPVPEPATLSGLGLLLLLKRKRKAN